MITSFVFLRNPHDRLHVGGLACEMYGDDRAGARGDGGCDGFGIKIERVEVNISKDGNRVGFDDGGRGGKKGCTAE